MEVLPTPPSRLEMVMTCMLHSLRAKFRRCENYAFELQQKGSRCAPATVAIPSLGTESAVDEPANRHGRANESTNYLPAAQQQLHRPR